MKLSLKVFIVGLFLVLSVSTLVAQEETAEPTVEQPTTEPTVEVTVDPTVEQPTSEPIIEVTADPTVEQPTSEPIIEVTVEPTVEMTPEASPTTMVSAPPVFNFAHGTTFDVNTGEAIEIAFTVIDEAGAVTVTAQSAVTLVVTPPVETSFPFNTSVTVVYTAAADFAGQDSLTLTAVDAAGVSSSAVLTLNVIAPEPTSELLIKYDPAASEETLQEMLRALGAVEIDRLPAIGVIRVRVPQTIETPNAAMSRLAQSVALTSVSAIEANGFYRPAFTPNDPQFPQQWALGAGTGGTATNYAWDLSTKRGAGIIVAVLDTGVDLSHPDLAGQLVAGWDFVNDDSNPSGDDDDDVDALDASGHGTRVAGIIAARTNNGVGIAGVAYLAKIMPVKVCTEDGLGECSFYHIAGGIIHAVDMGARVINLSLSGDTPSSTVQAAVNYALSQNVVVVAAAGNTSNTTLMYPASFDGVISVAAHDQSGTIAGTSTHNAQVDLSAPGVNILSTVPTSVNPSGYDSTSGTSLAAPHVAGAAALLMSANVATTPAAVREALICGAVDAGDPNFDEYYGFGRLKADWAMNWRGNSSNCKISQPNDNAFAPTRITRTPFTAIQPLHSRSVTAQSADPVICGQSSQQTLWYTFQPTVTGVYQVSTIGSSTPVIFGVYSGVPGALTQVSCSLQSQNASTLERGVLYTIVVGTSGSAVDNHIAQVRVNAALTLNNRDHQENVPQIAYSGTWVRLGARGASGRFTQMTTDVSASAMFSFRGTSFDYVRTVGPDRGSTSIFVNGALLTTVSNQGAFTAYNQTINIAIPAAGAGQWNTVRLERDASVPGSIDVDRIRTYDFDANTLAKAITSKVDERALQLRYFSVGIGNSWVDIPYAGAMNSTLRETSVENAYMIFRAKGNAITIYRMTGPGFADMSVTINDGDPIIISNVAATMAIRAYTIDGLIPMEHVVEIRKLGASNSIQLDAVQAATLGTLGANVTYNENVVQIAYRGIWTKNTSVAGALGGTTTTLEAGAEASFKFVGNDLCVGYRRPNGSLDVIIDGTLIGTIAADAGSGFSVWCVDATMLRLLPDTTHYARLVANGSTFTLDYVRPQRYNVITPARKVVQEIDPAMRYSPTTGWVRLGGAAATSPGGYKPQGGYINNTTVDNQSITFYIQGSGFVLYTSIGQSRGCYQLYVDGVEQVPIDLVDEAAIGYRPIGYGVTGLGAGIHRIELRSDTNCSSIYPPDGLPSTYPVDFDGVRALP